METRFNEFKEEILKRTKEANACRPEYGREYRSKTFTELMQVIKDNFQFAASGKIIEPTIIEAYKEEFNANMIWCNIDCSTGYLLVDSATVEASGSATVRAYDSAYVTSYYTIECQLSGNAIYRIRESNTIKYSSDNITFKRV